MSKIDWLSFALGAGSVVVLVTVIGLGLWLLFCWGMDGFRNG
jgi:hypothetical protein